MTQNYYDMLGVNRSASDKDIKAAYRRMARKLHPDVNPNDERAQDQFKKVNEAYEVVGDPARRKDYDQFGENWKHADQMRNMGGGRGPGGGMSFNLGDLFGGGHAQQGGASFADMFGGMGGHAQQQRPQTMKHKGSIDVSLDEVYTGATRRISIGTPNSGTTKRNLEVEVPRGVPDGRKIRLRPDGQTEVILKVNVRSDKRFSREGANLRADIAVPLLDAILGGETEVPTMTGRIALNIPAGTQNGRSFKIKGCGLPKMNSDEHGDLYATVKVRLPDTLSGEEQQLYAQLREIRKGEPKVDDLIDHVSNNEENAG
ncbi:MAG: J domain-containing protein [Dehalococcoidia bacterium]|jgi:DnaJ-class molecular chaperone|nr:J domain-containing protein [Dehalococcoidia bacterium]MDP7262620.1 J domain-containing protein [Dehalococcoidia bacterium]MDP7484641.1 J domain-containing protein [Dehalococcoidia bacterium]|tara:strand:+ start:3104 stop:4048 length:945 start_codon:yes stop_codon:yes gene_type:complete